VRFIYNASEETIKMLKFINTSGKKNLSLKGIFSEAVEFYFNVHKLVESGHKICLEDKDGNKKYFGKSKEEEDEKDFWDTED